MPSPTSQLALPAALDAAGLLAGCATMPGGKAESSSAPGGPATAATAAPTGPTIGPGANERGDVVGPAQVETGGGFKVEGLKDHDGEIDGNPVPGSQFAQLQIGMPLKAVLDIVGTPTDEGDYVTGKVFIPCSFGSDRDRHEVVYKGLGRLVFAGSSGFDPKALLIRIIHSADEPGYR